MTVMPIFSWRPDRRSAGANDGLISELQKSWWLRMTGLSPYSRAHGCGWSFVASVWRQHLTDRLGLFPKGDILAHHCSRRSKDETEARSQTRQRGEDGSSSTTTQGGIMRAWTIWPRTTSTMGPAKLSWKNVSGSNSRPFSSDAPCTKTQRLRKITNQSQTISWIKPPAVRNHSTTYSRGSGQNRSRASQDRGDRPTWQPSSNRPAWIPSESGSGSWFGWWRPWTWQLWQSYSGLGERSRGKRAIADQ
jgi:hypothetical protein